MTDAGVGIYIVNDGINILPGELLEIRDDILLNTFALADKLEAEMLRQRTQNVFGSLNERGVAHRSTPVRVRDIDGDGYLAPNDDYRRARDAIEAIEEMDWSVRKTARHTGIPRRTFAGTLGRREMYVSDGEK